MVGRYRVWEWGVEIRLGSYGQTICVRNRKEVMKILHWEKPSLKNEGESRDVKMFAVKIDKRLLERYILLYLSKRITLRDIENITLMLKGAGGSIKKKKEYAQKGYIQITENSVTFGLGGNYFLEVNL